MAIMERRRFLATTLVLGAGGALLLKAVVWDQDGESWIKVVRAIGEDGASIGRAYLGLAPDEEDTGELLRLVLPPQSSVERPPSEEELIRHLEQRIRRDFTAGATVEIDGWLLAMTEARLCALAFLA